VSRLLVSCGEPSGDLYGAALVRALREQRPDLSVFGLGGDHLEAEGATLLAHVRDLAVVGLVEVVKHLPHLKRVFARILDEVAKDPPDGAVLVDYPDFNLRLARALQARGVKVVYYVSPQVWAWRQGRVRAIARDVSRMLVIFPFEKSFYESAGVSVSFVGHPLVDLVKPAPASPAFFARHGLDPRRRIVTLAPGSRARELAHNLPGLLAAARRIHEEESDVQILLALAPALDPALVAHAPAPVVVVRGETHEALGASALALVASGTITVEAALLGTPMLVVYRLSPLTYALGRPFVRVPRYAMANLIAGREIVPEFIQGGFDPERVAREALSLLRSEARLQKMKADLAEVRRLLGGRGASERAAAAVDAALWGGP
jgi:lipid-A-disaccharide synthase